MSVDYTAILCYGYKLTEEEIESLGDRLYKMKEEYADLPNPFGLICNNDVYSCNREWYVGRWMENSSVSIAYSADEFMGIEERDMISINLMMDYIFQTENYVEGRCEESPEWYLFVRCW